MTPTQKIQEKLKSMHFGSKVTIALPLVAMSMFMGAFGGTTVGFISSSFKIFADNLTSIGYGCGAFNQSAPNYGANCAAITSSSVSSSSVMASLSTISSSSQVNSSSTLSSSAMSSSSQASSPSTVASSSTLIASSSTLSSSSNANPSSIISSSTTSNSSLVLSSISLVTSFSSTIVSSSSSLASSTTSSTVATTMGTPVATTSNPVVAGVGSTLPTISFTGSNIPNGSTATFTPAGTTTPLTGTIQNGNFVPTAGQIIPAGATTGAAVGVLSVISPTGIAPVNVPTNFAAATVVTPSPTGATTGGGVITITNNTNSNNPTPATNTTLASNQSTNPLTSPAQPTPATNSNKSLSVTVNQKMLELKDPYVCGVDGGYVYGAAKANPAGTVDMELIFSQNGKIVKTFTIKTDYNGNFKQILGSELAYGLYNYKVTARYDGLSASESFNINHISKEECESKTKNLEQENSILLARTGGASIIYILPVVTLSLLMLATIAKLKSKKNKFSYFF